MKKVITISTIIVLLVGSGVFYWFFYRPSEIRSACQKEADLEYTSLFDQYYQTQENGARVLKEHTWHEITFEEDQALKEAAQDIYEPCLQRNGL
jgi:guanylate kinase